MRLSARPAVAMLVLAIAAALVLTLEAQPRRRVQTIAASRTAELRSWNARIDELIGAGALGLARVQVDGMLPGRVHQRYGQRHSGVPVFGGEVVRQLAGDEVRSILGRMYQDVSVNPVPSITREEAIALALYRHGVKAVTGGDAMLGVLPTRDGRYVLAWRVPVRRARDVREIFVDAHYGVVVRDLSRLRAQLQHIGTGRGVGGDEKKVSASQRAQRFEAVDGTRPAQLETYSFDGSAVRLDGYLLTGLLFDADLATDDDNRWEDGAVVDGHVLQGWVYDYFFKRHGRRGMDDADGSVATIVHPLGRGETDPDGFFINNALYLGDQTMMFGDGDGRVFDAFAGAIDVVAHEWTHGVTEYSSNLSYSDEPGALNESYSDIMGTGVEFFYQPPGDGPREADWVIAEDVTLVPPGFIRSMRDPSVLGDPDHYSLVRFIGSDFDNGGIHINSGVPNQAFYLAVAGGTNRVSGITVEGVGLANIDRMEQIFYRAFTFFLGPDSTFSDARVATLLAASELYGEGSHERAQVLQAWTAVGVR